MRYVNYTDSEGLLQRALLPDDADEAEASLGVPQGVDIIEALERQGVPFETARRLQNELRARGFWTYRDVRRARATEELFAALQSAYRVDVAALVNIFKEVDNV